MKDYVSNLLEIDDSSFNQKLRTSQIHHYLFVELSLSPSSIYGIIESLITEYQPSMMNTSYYIGYSERYKLFLLLSHLVNNSNDTNSNYINNQIIKLRDYVATKLHGFIFNLVFPCKSGLFIYHLISLHVLSQKNKTNK